MKLRFFNPDVDVLLLELSAAIPSLFQPYRLGWDAASNAPPAAAVGIHYPHGAPRSISYTQCAGGPRAIDPSRTERWSMSSVLNIFFLRASVPRLYLRPSEALHRRSPCIIRACLSVLERRAALHDGISTLCEMWSCDA